ncbi:hypothetical protein ACQKWADRAFT_298690 [Trichoderma austrokoningii]
MQRDTSHQNAPNSDLSSTSRSDSNATCEACQKSKTTCSGGQPRCLSCAQQGISCQYASTETEVEKLMRKLLEERKKNSEYQFFFNAVKNMPLDESQAVYRLVRQRANITTVVHQIKEGKLSKLS